MHVAGGVFTGNVDEAADRVSLVRIHEVGQETLSHLKGKSEYEGIRVK